MGLTKDQIIWGLRGRTDLSLIDSYRIAVEWAKINCLTMESKYAFLRELYTDEQINMLIESDE